MDDFKKQELADAKYKEFKQKDTQEYKGDYESEHYNVVDATQIKATVQKDIINYNTQYKYDFHKATEDFWQKRVKANLDKYQSGYFIGSFGKDEYTVDEFFNRMSTLIKECVSNELKSNSISTEDLQDNFKSIEISFNLLSKTISNKDSNLNMDGLLAFFQGFINSYISNALIKKLEKEQKRKN